jgi:dTDP-4-amino-4,6-dideoxygalactose transaminase
MNIPFVDLRAQYRSIQAEADAAVLGVMSRGDFVLGQAVADFEKAFAAYCEADYCVGVDSGYSALELIVRAFDIGPGDEVITAANTFIATTLAISNTGARVVLVDCDPQTYNIDPTLIEAAITPRTKAIIPVHLYGQAVDMDGIKAAAPGIPIVEDCCQAIGTDYHGVPVGGLGLMGCFSFFPTKNLGAFGDGGLVTTNDEALGEKLVDMRLHGMRPKYVHHFVGGNFRLDALQAAILRVKLPRLDGWIAKRRASAAHYRQLFTAAGLLGHVTPPEELPGRGHTYHQYVVRVEQRDRLREHLGKLGLGTEVYYPISLHEQECFAPLGYRRGDFPESERAATEVMAMPIFPELRADERERMVEGIKSFYS